MKLRLTWIVLVWTIYLPSSAEILWSSVHAGDAVTVECRLQETSDLRYWFMQRPGQGPTTILFHRASGGPASYFNGYGHNFTPSFDRRTHCSRLRIANISVSDAGVYYCAARTGGEMKFGTGTALAVTGVSENAREGGKTGSDCFITGFTGNDMQILWDVTLSNRTMGTQGRMRSFNVQCKVSLEDGRGMTQSCQCETMDANTTLGSTDIPWGLNMLSQNLCGVIGLLIVILFCVLIYFNCFSGKALKHPSVNSLIKTPRLTEAGPRPQDQRLLRDQRLPRDQQLTNEQQLPWGQQSPQAQRLSRDRQLPQDQPLPRAQRLPREQRLPPVQRSPHVQQLAQERWTPQGQCQQTDQQLPRKKMQTGPLSLPSKPQIASQEEPQWTQQLPQESQVHYSTLNLVAMEKKTKKR
ncbi:uncharacterized protein [Mobula birostris]|uniref:uncharacterized protein isoform X1 n=1 Tax=Mobula birostris TaxID=1983395 RepID=UPI003B28CEC0